MKLQWVLQHFYFFIYHSCYSCYWTFSVLHLHYYSKYCLRHQSKKKALITITTTTTALSYWRTFADIVKIYFMHLLTRCNGFTLCLLTFTKYKINYNDNRACDTNGQWYSVQFFCWFWGILGTKIISGDICWIHLKKQWQYVTIIIIMVW